MNRLLEAARAAYPDTPPGECLEPLPGMTESELEQVILLAAAAVCHDSSSGPKWELLGESLMLLPNLAPMAIEAFEKAHSLSSPPSCKAAFYLAQSQSGEAALALYEECLSCLGHSGENEKYADVCALIAELYMTDLCFADDAEKKCLAAIENGESKCPSHVGLAVQRCSYLTVTNDLDAARRIASELYKKFASAHSAVHQMDDDAAMDDNEEPLDEADLAADYDLQLTLARIMTDIGLAAESIVLLEYLHELNETDDRILHRLALAHMIQKDYEQALEAVNSAIAMRTEKGEACTEEVDEGEVSVIEELQSLRGEILKLLEDSSNVVECDAPTEASSGDDETTEGDNLVKRARVDGDYIEEGKSFSLSDADAARVILLEPRNRLLTDEELNDILPTEGYEVLQPPLNYVRTKAISRELAEKLGLAEGGATFLTGERSAPLPAEYETYTTLPAAPDIAMTDLTMKKEDFEYFRSLFQDIDESTLSSAELKERRVALLLLKIKNGTPPLRRAALKQITARALEFGPEALFNQILPLMMQCGGGDDQERHLLVKVIDRVLYKLDDRVKPYVHKILVVTEPLLIDEDYYARVEGREIISNLSKAAGLATMIATMRPDVDHPDEYVRNTTARAFAVVASSLGINSLLLFLKAVCQSKKSWQARHTGIKIVQQIAILMGCAILPFLKSLVEIVSAGLQDENLKVRTNTALALASLAEAAHPYGIETFDCVLRPLWQGICEYRGKGLAAFLKAMGLIIPLMEPEHADLYTREIIKTLVREFASPDDEMKKIVLKVVQLCTATEGVEGAFLKAQVLQPFLTSYMTVRNSLDRATRRQLVETTVELSKKCGAAEVIRRLVAHLKHTSSESFRRMMLEIIEKIIVDLGIEDIDTDLEEILVDGLLFSFQELSAEGGDDILNSIGVILNALGVRVKPYLKQITGVIRWRLNTPSARVRQQAADLISKIASVMKKCNEEQMLSHFGLFLYEYLGEEYPEVLGSILCALKCIVNVIGIRLMNPPVKDLLPRLTPILKNRHEKVQENVIDLIGRIADRGGDMVSPKEWDRICYDLLELLKAHKKSIKRTAVNTFGYIARTIGPHDVMVTLMNNLRVQERQLRLCTTIAIAIIAETCLPYTVLPALMNEYRVPDVNVQHGVLKTLSFLFEYIGEMSRDYIYAVTPLLQDALMDRDIVHRQTAAWATKHLALGVHGLSREDALIHLLNYVWPNIFETPAHLSQATFDAVCGLRVALGPGIMLNYILQGLFHPARKVRDVYWRIYNSIYIDHNDALISFYPEIENDEGNRYDRPELEMVL